MLRPALPLVLSLLAVPAVLAELAPLKPAPAAPAPEAPAKPLSPEAMEKLLAQLQEIETALDGKRISYNNSVLPKLKDAGADENKAFALWLDAMKDQEFEANGKSATEFADFRNGQAKELRARADFATQLRLQCRFLALLVLQSGAVTDSARQEVVSGATAYLEDYVSNIKKLRANDGKQEELGRGAMDSVIAKHLKLDVTARGGKGGGAPGPADVAGIYDRMILPVYREKKAAAAISAAWTKRISQETALVEAAKVPEKVDQFNKERLPELKWGQARDLFEAGQQEPATLSMVALIKANLGHKNASGWISELTGLIEQAGKTVPAAGASTAPVKAPVTTPAAKR